MKERFSREKTAEALRVIIENKEAKALRWAINYTRYALSIIESGSLSELHTQLFYVVSNISHWRGAQAKQVRAELKKQIGLLKEELAL